MDSDESSECSAKQIIIPTNKKTVVVINVAISPKQNRAGKRAQTPKRYSNLDLAGKFNQWRNTKVHEKDKSRMFFPSSPNDKKPLIDKNDEYHEYPEWLKNLDKTSTRERKDQIEKFMFNENEKCEEEECLENQSTTESFKKNRLFFEENSPKQVQEKLQPRLNEEPEFSGVKAIVHKFNTLSREKQFRKKEPEIEVCKEAQVKKKIGIFQKLNFLQPRPKVQEPSLLKKDFKTKENEIQEQEENYDLPEKEKKKKKKRLSFDCANAF